MLKTNFLNVIYVFFLGAISSYSLPPYNYFIINFFTFSLFFIFLYLKRKTSSSNKSFFKYGWLFGFGYFLCSLYWIAISLTFDESFKFLIPIAIVLLPAFLAIFYGLITYFFSLFFSKNVVVTFFIFSILYGSVEFIRGIILTGFPWNLIAFSFSESIHFIQIVSVIGTYSFNLFCISLFTVPAIFILRNNRKEIIVCFLFIVVSTGFLIFGNSKYNQFNNSTDIKNNFTIRAVSPNISLDRFYSKQDEFKIIKELILLSNPEKKEPTVFLWPEGIIPDSYLRDMGIYKELFSKNFGNDDLIIMGINSIEIKDGENLFFNSMALFDNKVNLIQSYNKVNLVPFGEFTPFEKIFSLLGLKTVTNDYQSFSKGENLKALSIKNEKIELKLLPLICYEIIYPNRLFEDKNFDYIVNISEDGWFGNSVGPKQHLAHSIFRSIESGKYVIRSTNNGISAIINPIGIIEKKVEFGSTGYVDFKKGKASQSTFYMNYGNKTFFMIILLYIFLIISFKKIKYE